MMAPSPRVLTSSLTPSLARRFSTATRFSTASVARRFSTARVSDDELDSAPSALPGEIYTDAHHAVMKSIAKFIEKEINPHVDEWESDGIFPARELFKKYGALGFLGLTKPVEFGGQGLDYTYALAASEALGGIECGALPMAISVQTDMATPALALHGSDEVRREFLAPSISGEYVACLGVSEVGGGSDVAALKTTAVKEGDEYVIDGHKMWTTNGTQAHWMCALVNTSDACDGVHRNKTLVCIPMDAKGVSVAPRFDKLGMRSSDTTQVTLEGVRVPQKWRIGREGHGFMC